MRLLCLLGLLLSFFSFGSSSPEKYVYISTDADAVSSIQGFVSSSIELKKHGDRVAVLKVPFGQLENISHLMHHRFQRCGGYILHDSASDAYESVEEVQGFWGGRSRSEIETIDYDITESERVKAFLPQLEERGIRNFIKKFSSYHDRYYQSETGVASARWLASHWKKLSNHRSDVRVQLIKHKKWAQESVVMTVLGSKKPEEIVILGGHGDSINQRHRGGHAPGADDNASGIGSITEVIRVLMKMGYKPERTIQFMSYSAEEVGLRGSYDIATRYRNESKKIIGVMQLDMTGFHGTPNKDIVMMSDYTSKKQNQFLGKLMDFYLGLNWGYSRCGYACSDHASWHKRGYPASMPFETTMRDINPRIHTSQDTLENMGGDASHALKFAQLALAYMIEVAK